MEGMEDYQDYGDDFWNQDSSAIYDNLPPADTDYNIDIFVGHSQKKLKERTKDYSEPFTINQINLLREKLFTKFRNENFKLYTPLRTMQIFKFGKYKGKFVEDIFEEDINYIKYLIDESGAIFRLKDRYTFAINCGLDIPIILLNEMKMEYYEGTVLSEREVFNGEEILKVKDLYYNLYL